MPMNISATEFKAKCLKLIDEVAETHEPLVITKRGKPVARLMPIDDRIEESGFGYMSGTVTIPGDILAPRADAWSGESGDEAALYADLPPRRRTP
jgi:prevent-host-death family protein